MSSMFELFRKAKPFEPLYFACVERARAPWFYLHAGIPDEIAGRFELVALHVSIMIHESIVIDYSLYTSCTVLSSI